MKLLPKLALFSLAVSAVPLVIAGYSSARISRRHLRVAINENELLVARQAADYIASHLSALQGTLGIETRVLDLSRAGRAAPAADVMRGFLQLVYHQSDDFSAVLALDGEGQPVVPAVFQTAPRDTSAAGGHEAFRAEDAPVAARATPVAEALGRGSAIGTVFRAGPAGSPHLVLAVRYERGPEAPPLVLAAAVSLRPIARYLAGLSSQDRALLLVDGEGRLVISGRGDAAGPRLGETGHGPARAPDEGGIEEYESAGRRVIGAFAGTGTFGLTAVSERPLAVALSPVRKLEWSTLYWMGISGLVAAAVGALLARTLARRVGALVGGARNIAVGRLDTELEVESNDELGELARAFNAMATSLSTARDEILRQTEEIRAWNESLERRVDEKTRALREAQELLLRSRSLAALGSLGAGVAHEINNPLSGVLGLTQLLLADLPGEHPSRPLLQDIEGEARRIQTIVAQLLRLAQQQAPEAYRPVALDAVLADALDLCGLTVQGDGPSEGQVEVERRLPSPCPPVRGDGAQLQAALIQLLQNAKGAMEGRGRITVEVSLPTDELVQLRITDTGRGISPEHLPRVFDPFFTTKARPTDVGIGLSLVHKIVEDHGGTIKVSSEPGRGTTFVVTLPRAQERSHLT